MTVNLTYINFLHGLLSLFLSFSLSLFLSFSLSLFLLTNNRYNFVSQRQLSLSFDIFVHKGQSLVFPFLHVL